MKALRIQVERVVHPICASSMRKDRMREELFSHLSALYEQELSKTNNSSQATAEAIRRFGDPVELAQELQATVPAIERWAFFPLLSRYRPKRRLGESPVGFLFRCLFRTFAVVMITQLLVIAALVLFVNPSAREVPTPIGYLVTVAVGSFSIIYAGMILHVLVVEGIRRTLENSGTASSAPRPQHTAWRIAGYTVLGAVVVWGGSSAGLLLLFQHLLIPVFTANQSLWVVIGATALGVPITLLNARDWHDSIRRFDQWQALDLEQRLSCQPELTEP